jgi:hypothetical protein
MKKLVKRLTAAWLCLGLACALPWVAAGAGSEGPRWVPALAVFDVVIAQQTEVTAGNAIHPSASDDGRLVLAVVAADGLITPTASEDETGHGIPPEATVEGAILENASGDVVVAIPVVVARADQETPASASSASVPPEAAGGEPAPKDETERWVPSFSLFSGVLVQNADGELASGPIRGDCALSPRSLDTLHCERQIRPTASIDIDPDDPVVPPVEFVTISGGDRMVTPFVGGSLELMTPGLTSLPGRPRLFVHGDAAASFSATRDVAKEGVPDAFEVAEGSQFTSEATVLGQGSTTSAQVMPLVISAGAGVAFTLEAWERRIRIKPSVEYVREEIEVEGIVKRAVQTRYTPAPRADEFPDGFRLIELSGREKRVFHGIGPGLEVEMDTLRAGPFMLAVYVSGNAYAFLGDREVEFSDTNEDGESAAWHFEKDEWAFRGFVGLRFRWVPE